MMQWLRDLWRRNVIIEVVVPEAPDAEWEAVESATLPVKRCRRCGELVRAAYLSEHLRESHGRRVVTLIRLFDNGDSEVDVARGMQLMPQHVRIIKEFLEQQTNVMLEDAVAEINRVGARGQAQLLALLDTRGQVN